MRIAEELEIEENYYKSYDFIWWTTAAGRNRQSYLYTSYYTFGRRVDRKFRFYNQYIRYEIFEKMCKKYSQTMIIVTHDERIAAMADRIIQMKDGRVV